jgi:plastocyanin
MRLNVMQKIVRLSATIALVGSCTAWIASTSGCATTPAVGDSASQPVEFSLHPSTQAVTPGQSITVIARSANTLGHNTSVDWASTGGEMTTEQNKRLARLKFDQPGAYTVSAVLRMDGNVVGSDSVEINVKQQ